MALTTTELLTDIKLLGNIPDTTDTSSVNYDANILSVASRILILRLVPAILSIQEDYYTTTSETTIVAGQARYRLPSRAISGSLRDVRIRRGTEERSLAMVPQERRRDSSAGEVIGFYLEGDEVVLYQTPSKGGDTLILSYFRSPNRLALVSDCDTVSVIHDDYIETTGALSGDLTKDFIRAEAPHSFVATATTVDFGAASTGATPPTSLSVGDYVAPVGTSPVVQAPDIAWYILSGFTTAAVLRALGSADYAAHEDAAKADLANWLQTLTPRVQGELPPILPPM